MYAVIAPEPAPWIAPLLDELDGPVWLFAPWDLSLFAPLKSARLARWRCPAREDTRVRSVPGWPIALAASRLWERGRTDRQLAARFAFRAAVDALASAALPLGELRAVIAPSGAARMVFARASSLAQPVERTLIQDLPVLSALHRSLDEAASAHPESAFLRRFRAGHSAVSQQRAEWQLATRVRSRGSYATRSLREFGCTTQIDEPAPVGRSAPLAIPPRPSTILLAGFAAARNGTHESLALLHALPESTLLVRRGEGSEPRALFEHPRVRESTRLERETLSGVDVVIAPAFVEGYSPEIPAAIARGVPIVATERACGACVPDARIDRPSDLHHAFAELQTRFASVR